MSSAGWPAKQMHMEQTWRHWTETGRGNQELSTLLFHPPPPSPLKPRQRRQERLQSASHGVVSSTPVLCSCTTVPGMQGTPSVPVASQAQWAGPTPLLLCMGWAGGKGDRPVSNKPWKIRSESSISLNILWSKGSKATNCQNTAQVTQGSHKETKQMAKAEFTDCTS